MLKIFCVCAGVVKLWREKNDKAWCSEYQPLGHFEKHHLVGIEMVKIGFLSALFTVRGISCSNDVKVFVKSTTSASSDETDCDAQFAQLKELFNELWNRWICETLRYGPFFASPFAFQIYNWIPISIIYIFLFQSPLSLLYAISITIFDSIFGFDNVQAEKKCAYTQQLQHTIHAMCT